MPIELVHISKAMLNVSNLPDFDSTRSLPKAEFVARHRCLFLMFAARNGTAGLGFKTTVAHLDELEDTDHDLGGDLGAAEVLALQKAPGNPDGERISLGRARNCDLVLRDPSVSKLHAHFLIATADAPGCLHLADLESQNGTLLNGKPLVPNVAVPVDVGAALRFGGVVAHLVDAARLFDLMEFAE